MVTKKFGKENTLSDKNFRHQLGISAILSAENGSGGFSADKTFVGQNFRRQANFSAILSAEFLSDKTCVMCVHALLLLFTLLSHFIIFVYIYK